MNLIAKMVLKKNLANVKKIFNLFKDIKQSKKDKLARQKSCKLKIKSIWIPAILDHKRKKMKSFIFSKPKSYQILKKQMIS